MPHCAPAFTSYPTESRSLKRFGVCFLFFFKCVLLRTDLYKSIHKSQVYWYTQYLFSKKAICTIDFISMLPWYDQRKHLRVYISFSLPHSFSIIERGGKMLYLNTSIRGYPKGLRAGSDPRAPKLCVNEDFDQLTYLNTPYPLDAIEVRVVLVFFDWRNNSQIFHSTTSIPMPIP